jgi:hypothetical protein
VIALAAAVRRVAEAKAQIASREATRCSLFGRGDLDAASAVALQIGDLRCDLELFEAILASVTTQVHDSFAKMIFETSRTVQKRPNRSSRLASHYIR